ncbi:MAG TPA: hypothetical protein VKF14_20060 [Candidatus Dormibacteraeota bacterium]|nr:hypothetical protein [Candidatus Dormibacteraeota bacterium]
MRAGLVDLLDISVHPMFLGSGGMLVRDGLSAGLTLVGTKVFSRIVKLSYAVSPPPGNDGGYETGRDAWLVAHRSEAESDLFAGIG